MEVSRKAPGMGQGIKVQKELLTLVECGQWAVEGFSVGLEEGLRAQSLVQGRRVHDS